MAPTPSTKSYGASAVSLDSSAPSTAGEGLNDNQSSGWFGSVSHGVYKLFFGQGDTSKTDEQLTAATSVPIHRVTPRQATVENESEHEDNEDSD